MEKKNKIINIIFFIFIFVFLLFVGSGNFISPFYGEINLIDEGLSGAWISHMLSGKHLYLDTYSAYGPFYIFPSYILSKIFGQSLFLIRLTYIVFGVFLSLLVIKAILNKLLIPNIIQFFAIVLLVIFSTVGIRQASGYLVILLGFFAMEKNKYFWSVACGMTIAFSFLISVDYGIFALFTCSLLFIYELVTKKDIKSVMEKLLLILSGAFVVFFLFFAWSSKEGWFMAFLNSTLDDLVTYSGINLPIGKGFPNALTLFPQSLSWFLWIKYIVSKELLLYWLFVFYIIFFLYLFVRLILKKSKNEDLLIFLIGIYGFLMATVLIGRYGHFTSALSSVVIIFAYYFNILVHNFRSTKNQPDKVFFFLMMLIICAFSIRVILFYRPHFPKILKIPEAVLATKNNPPLMGNIFISEEQKKSIQTIQEFVANNTGPDETIFFFSNEPAMYFLTNRRNPTKYDLPEVASLKEKRMEILDSLKKDKTKYIIEDTKAYDLDEISNRRRLPEVFEFIRNNYETTRLGQYIIYKIKEN